MKTREELIAHIEKVEGERDRARSLMYHVLVFGLDDSLKSELKKFLTETSLVKP